MTDDYALNPERELCARCGEVARGYAIGALGRLCHPDDPTAPDCYSLASRDLSRMRLAEAGILLPDFGAKRFA